jgi:hypothetical protein
MLIKMKYIDSKKIKLKIIKISRDFLSLNRLRNGVNITRSKPIKLLIKNRG